jgi:hypothetical protein
VFSGAHQPFSRGPDTPSSTPSAYACEAFEPCSRVRHRDQHDRVGGDARRSAGRKPADGRGPSLVGGSREERVQTVRSDGHTQRLEPDHTDRENVSTRAGA